MGFMARFAGMKLSNGMGVLPAIIQRLKDKKSGQAKGVQSMPGQSPLGISQTGNVSGGLQAAQGASPLGKMLK